MKKTTEDVLVLAEKSGYMTLNGTIHLDNDMLMCIINDLHDRILRLEKQQNETLIDSIGRDIG